MRYSASRFKRLLLTILHSPRLVPVSSILFITIFILTLIAGLENARVMRVRIKDDFLHQQALLAKQTSAQFSQELESVKSEVRSLFRLMAVTPGADLAPHVQESYLRLRGKGVIEVGVIDPDGEVYDVHDPGSACLTLDLAQLERSGSPFRTVILPGACKPGHLTLCTYSPLPEDAPPGKLPRVSFAHLDLAKLSHTLLADFQRLTGSGAWVIDSDARYLFHSNSTLIGNLAIGATQGQESGKADSDPFSLLIDRMSNGETGFCELPEENLGGLKQDSDRLIVFTPLATGAQREELLGSLAFETPTHSILHGLETLYFRQYIAEGGLLAGLLLFGLLVASYQQRMSRSLKSLVSEQDQILSGILANSVDAVVVIDENDHIQMWNRGAQRIFGYTPEEVLGKPLHMLIPPDLKPEEETRQIQEQLSQSGYLTSYTTQRLTREGRRITVDISRTPFQSPDGSISGSTAVIRDITEKVELDQRMYNTEKLASIGLLASGVAHEINNPLAIVLGMADLLKERFPEGSETRCDLEMIEENANQAQKIVQDLLDFSRASERHEGRMDLLATIRKLASFILHTKLNGDVTLELELPDNLPEVAGDPRELQQVLLNLINNSLAAVDPRKGRIDLRARAENGWVVIQVEDNGKGIHTDIQQRVFDPFFTTKDVGEGTGLGLSLCYGIVHKWGGEIAFRSPVASEPRGEPGTLFTIRLPIQRGEER